LQRDIGDLRILHRDHAELDRFVDVLNNGNVGHQFSCCIGNREFNLYVDEKPDSQTRQLVVRDVNNNIEQDLSIDLTSSSFDQPTRLIVDKLTDQLQDMFEIPPNSELPDVPLVNLEHLFNEELRASRDFVRALARSQSESSSSSPPKKTSFFDRFRTKTVAPKENAPTQFQNLAEGGQGKVFKFVLDGQEYVAKKNLKRNLPATENQTADVDRLTVDAELEMLTKPAPMDPQFGNQNPYRSENIGEIPALACGRKAREQGIVTDQLALPMALNIGSLNRGNESRTRNPHVLTISPFVSGRPFITSIAGRIVEPRDIGEALKTFSSLAEALKQAKNIGIVNRDIKPENLMVDRDGKVTILDWGNSYVKIGTENEAREQFTLLNDTGSAAYMPPEQVFCTTPDCFNDMYSTGMVLYEAIFRTPIKDLCGEVGLNDSMKARRIMSSRAQSEKMFRQIEEKFDTKGLQFCGNNEELYDRIIGLARSATSFDPEERPTPEQFQIMINDIKRDFPDIFPNETQHSTTERSAKPPEER
jgi:serine/threonine protein kinase